ncbi:MAG: T9SS type A sorting domain-containing protein [Ignavibacteriae bacterium]|nr:T9SS type A sorting domain-containing protein [Ignavibacteriota bacterium]
MKSVHTMQQAALLWFVFLSSAIAQQPVWQRTPGPYAASIRSLTVIEGLVLAATDGEIYYSTNDGALWHPALLHRDDVSIVSKIHLGPSGRFYAGTDRGILISSDYGATWFPTGNPWHDIRAVATNSNGKMFAGGWMTGLLTSLDSGMTWSPFALPGVYCQQILIDQWDNIFVASRSGIHRSSDGGASWSFDEIGDFSFRDFALTSSGLMVLCSWDGGIFRSSDRGLSWESLNLRARHIEALLSTSSGEIYAAADTGVYYSADDGTSWTFIGLANKNVHALATTLSGDLLAGTLGKGVFRLPVEATVWEPCSTGFVNTTASSLTITPTGTLIAGVNGTLFRSTDNGETWTISYDPMWGGVGATALDHLGNVLAGVGADFLRSTDDGISWHRIAGLGSLAAIAITGQSTLFTANAGGDVYRSTTNGQNWTKVRTGDGEDYVTSILATQSDNIFLGILRYGPSDGDILRSTNNGASWISVGRGQIDDAVLSLAFHPSGKIFAGTFTKGIFVSDESRTSWDRANTGMENHHVREIVISRGGRIYAGTAFGIYSSSDQGSSWTSMNDGLALSFVSSLAISPTGDIFAGVQNHGLFRARGLIDEQNLPDELWLAQNYPNPFNTTTTIEFAVPFPAFTTLKIFNVLGEEVRVLQSEYMTQGVHRIVWDAKDISSGIYFYQLLTGNRALTKRMMLVK